MKLYNTLTRQVEDFVPWDENEVKFYMCGPTVYHYAHIGNMRSYVGHDMLYRTLKYLGYNVKRAMNITDVGHLSSDSDTGVDKMVASAQKANKSVLDIAEFYTNEFFKEYYLLNCIKPEIISPATENIDEYIKIITKLLDEDKAYISGGNVYFDTSKLNDYYVLTNHKEDDMVVGVRKGVERDDFKRNQADFVLWFTKSKFADQELKWPSPWGYGYPGWHIECTGISIKHLGEYLDIHGGGVDNIFPHHTNEIAQSEGYLGHKWCKYWYHNEHLNDETGKMSKSKGNILTVSVLKEQGYNPLAYRFMCLNSHYRKQMVFTYDGLTGAENAYKKLLNKIKSLANEGKIETDSYESYESKFKNEISNDLNMANAITLLYDLLKDDTVNDATKIKLISGWDNVFGLDLLKKDESIIDEELKKYIEEKINERKEAKQNKDYAKADEIRSLLESKNIFIKDTREGTTYEIR